MLQTEISHFIVEQDTRLAIHQESPEFEVDRIRDTHGHPVDVEDGEMCCPLVLDIPINTGIVFWLMCLILHK